MTLKMIENIDEKREVLLQRLIKAIKHDTHTSIAVPVFIRLLAVCLAHETGVNASEQQNIEYFLRDICAEIQTEMRDTLIASASSGARH